MNNKFTDRFFDSLVIITILTVLLYLATYRYFSGVFEYFNISNAFIEISLPEFLSLSGTFITILTVFAIYFLTVFMTLSNKIFAYDCNRLLIYFFYLLMNLAAFCLCRKLSENNPTIFSNCIIHGIQIIVVALPTVYLFKYKTSENCKLINWFKKFTDSIVCFVIRPFISIISFVLFVILFLWFIKNIGCEEYKHVKQFMVIQDSLIVIKKNPNNYVTIRIPNEPYTKDKLICDTCSDSRKVYIINSNQVESSTEIKSIDFED